MLQRVKMLSTHKAVHDGEIHPVAFIEGEEYDVGAELLQSFIDLGAVDLVAEDAQGQKSRGDAPSNKMKKAAPDNKAR